MTGKYQRTVTAMNLDQWRTPGIVLGCGAAILAVSMGIRHTFGLFLPPMSMDYGWGREVFAFAIALQNLVWGLAQPVTGMIADRFGAGKTILVGSFLYALGLLWMAAAQTPGDLALSAGLLIGLGLSGTTFAVVFGAVSRAMPPGKRSVAMGISSAVGSLGQFAMLPGSMGLMSWVGWATTLVLFAGLALAMVPLSSALFEERLDDGSEPHISVRDALAEALSHRGFWLLSLGFFVCGFQVVFIAIHLPAFLLDQNFSPAVGTTVLALIGLFNVIGTYLAGHWGGHYSKPGLLSSIYAGRAIVIAAFVYFPTTAASAYAFGIAMGLLWLSTVPLTNGTVAVIFGVRNMSMLGGVVFLFHQIGAFLGGWVGGYVYDQTGSYDSVWLMAIALSVIAMLLNLPIREDAVPRLKTSTGAS